MNVEPSEERLKAGTVVVPIKRAAQGWEEMVEALTVTKEQVQAIEDATPVWLKLVWHQKYHVWCAPPNAGKTAIAREAAAAIASAGFEVYYFNLDAGADDIKYHHAHAEEHGYRLLAPLKDGTTDDDAKRVIDAMLMADDLAHVVVILDTLKKFADLFSKRDAPIFYKKLRALTRRGCTVLALAHTNKYKSDTGELVPDGVGDLKNDCDMLMFLYHIKDDVTGDLTVSTKFDKERALTADATFHISRTTRAVTLEAGYRDTLQESVLRIKEAADWTLIEFIKERLPANQSQIVAAVKAELSAGRRSVERVLRTYVDRHWSSERATASNERRYRSLP